MVIKRLELAAKMMELQAHATLVRANIIAGSENQIIAHLLEISKAINDIMVACLNEDKTKLYLIK